MEFYVVRGGGFNERNIPIPGDIRVSSCGEFRGHDLHVGIRAATKTVFDRKRVKILLISMLPACVVFVPACSVVMSIMDGYGHGSRQAPLGRGPVGLHGIDSYD